MDKPFAILIKEFKDNLVSTINTSGLHISTIEPILKNIYNDVAIQSARTYEHEKELYEKSLQEDQAEEVIEE